MLKKLSEAYIHMTHAVKSLADTFGIIHLIIRIRNSPNGYLTGVCYLALYYIRAKGSCITISLVFVACSIHSNWEVVVWDGALPGGGGMQDPSWQLRLDVLCWQQDQNHKGKITSLDHGETRCYSRRVWEKCIAVQHSLWYPQNIVVTRIDFHCKLTC